MYGKYMNLHSFKHVRSSRTLHRPLVHIRCGNHRTFNLTAGETTPTGRQVFPVSCPSHLIMLFLFNSLFIIPSFHPLLKMRPFTFRHRRHSTHPHNQPGNRPANSPPKVATWCWSLSSSCSSPSATKIPSSVIFPLLLLLLLLTPSAVAASTAPGSCSHYITSGPAASTFTHHRFYDFRSLPADPNPADKAYVHYGPWLEGDTHHPHFDDEAEAEATTRSKSAADGWVDDWAVVNWFRWEAWPGWVPVSYREDGVTVGKSNWKKNETTPPPFSNHNKTLSTYSHRGIHICNLSWPYLYHLSPFLFIIVRIHVCDGDLAIPCT